MQVMQGIAAKREDRDKNMINVKDGRYDLPGTVQSLRDGKWFQCIVCDGEHTFMKNGFIIWNGLEDNFLMTCRDCMMKTRIFDKWHRQKLRAEMDDSFMDMTHIAHSMLAGGIGPMINSMVAAAATAEPKKEEEESEEEEECNAAPIKKRKYI